MKTSKYKKITNELVREAIDKNGSFRFRVEGFSMFPFLVEGDEVIIEKVPIQDLKIGEIVTYIRDEMLIVHRIKRIDGVSNKMIFVTQGDNLNHEDLPVMEKEIIGRVRTVIRGEKSFSPPVLLPEFISMLRFVFGMLRRLKKVLKLNINSRDIISFLRGK